MEYLKVHLRMGTFSNFFVLFAVSCNFRIMRCPDVVFNNLCEQSLFRNAFCTGKFTIINSSHMNFAFIKIGISLNQGVQQSGEVR